jgi:hypothetical protein
MPCSAVLALGLVDCYYRCRRRWPVFRGQRGPMDGTGREKRNRGAGTFQVAERGPRNRDAGCINSRGRGHVAGRRAPECETGQNALRRSLNDAK